MGLRVFTFAKGLLDENTYLIVDEDTNECAVIDPGYFGNDITNTIDTYGNLKYILLTHGHFDHFNAVNEYKNKYPNSIFYAPLKDKMLIEGGNEKEFASFGYTVNNCTFPDEYISEPFSLELGNSILNFIDTPGHTAGGMCIVSGNTIFSGDTLFRLSVGNTSFATGNWKELVKSIQTKLYSLDDNTLVYPGHGETTTIGIEKESNPFV